MYQLFALKVQEGQTVSRTFPYLLHVVKVQGCICHSPTFSFLLPLCDDHQTSGMTEWFNSFVVEPFNLFSVQISKNGGSFSCWAFTYSTSSSISFIFSHFLLTVFIVLHHNTWENTFNVKTYFSVFQLIRHMNYIQAKKSVVSFHTRGGKKIKNTYLHTENLLFSVESNVSLQEMS